MMHTSGHTTFGNTMLGHLCGAELHNAMPGDTRSSRHVNTSPLLALYLNTHHDSNGVQQLAQWRHLLCKRWCKAKLARDTPGAL